MNEGTSNPAEAFRRLNKALAGRNEAYKKKEAEEAAAERARQYRADKSKRGEPPYITSKRK